MSWSGNQCRLRDDEDRNIDVQVLQGCPMVSLSDGQRLLEWLEHYQVYQQRKLAMVRTLLADETQVDRSRLDLELALTYKLCQHFPNLPDDLMMRIVPHLELVKTEGFESRLPWNRRKHRRLRRAKHVVIHLFSGPIKLTGIGNVEHQPRRRCAWTLHVRHRRTFMIVQCMATC